MTASVMTIMRETRKVNYRSKNGSATPLSNGTRKLQDENEPQARIHCTSRNPGRTLSAGNRRRRSGLRRRPSHRRFEDEDTGCARRDILLQRHSQPAFEALLFPDEGSSGL